MGLCEQIHDRMPTRYFLVDVDRWHNKYPLTQMDKERMDFAVIDVQKVIEEF